MKTVDQVIFQARKEIDCWHFNPPKDKDIVFERILNNIESSYRNEISFWENECRKAGIIIDRLKGNIK